VDIPKKYEKIEEEKLEMETAANNKVINGKALFLKEIIEENKKQKIIPGMINIRSSSIIKLIV